MIHKFGLEHCDLPTMLWNVSFLLRALTLNIDGRYKKRKHYHLLNNTLTLTRLTDKVPPESVGPGT
uniref:Odorant receptor 18 n=1 Tax=Streltzoviella insularis TaxID=1206366 RepID=A0A7D5YIM4_9NEOP|nr:odorant receptor 18 [Streltzoviella insularis]